MLPDFGFGEFLILAIVALVVVGPRDLPKLMRAIGEFFGKMKGMARDFQRSFDEMGREAELDELRREIEAIKKADPTAEVRREFEGAASDAAQAYRGKD